MGRRCTARPGLEAVLSPHHHSPECQYRTVRDARLELPRPCGQGVPVKYTQPSASRVSGLRPRLARPPLRGPRRYRLRRLNDVAVSSVLASACSTLRAGRFLFAPAVRNFCLRMSAGRAAAREQPPEPSKPPKFCRDSLVVDTRCSVVNLAN